MIFAKGLKDLIKSTQLSYDFFAQLDEFSFHYLDMCFKKLYDDQMGMFTELENYNYEIFEEYKTYYYESKLSDDEDYWKKVG